MLPLKWYRFSHSKAGRPCSWLGPGVCFGSGTPSFPPLPTYSFLLSRTLRSCARSHGEGVLTALIAYRDQRA